MEHPSFLKLNREIVLLQNLRVLSLPNNKINGEIAEEVFALRNLADVDLSSNEISGSLPETLEKSAVLESFNIEMNAITGSIPDLSLSTDLTYVNFAGNRFQGSLPSWLFDMSNIEEIYLNDNQMIGSISSEIGTISTLEKLNLNRNTLTDQIPSEIGDLLNLGEWALPLVGNVSLVNVLSNHFDIVGSIFQSSWI